MTKDDLKKGLYNALKDASKLKGLRGSLRRFSRQSIEYAMTDFTRFTAALCERKGYSRTNVLLAFAEYINNMLTNAEKDRFTLQIVNLVYKATYLVVINTFIILEEEK